MLLKSKCTFLKKLILTHHRELLRTKEVIFKFQYAKYGSTKYDSSSSLQCPKSRLKNLLHIYGLIQQNQNNLILRLGDLNPKD